MSDEYTPTYEVIQDALEYFFAGCGGHDPGELDRFIAKERAEAWDEAMKRRQDASLDEADWPLSDWLSENPYRKDRA